MSIALRKIIYDRINVGYLQKINSLSHKFNLFLVKKKKKSLLANCKVILVGRLTTLQRVVVLNTRLKNLKENLNACLKNLNEI